MFDRLKRRLSPVVVRKLATGLAELRKIESHRDLLRLAAQVVGLAAAVIWLAAAVINHVDVVQHLVTLVSGVL
jgi:hypothetical protein